MYIVILLLFFFVGSVVIFTFVTFLYFFPFSLPPPPWNESMAFSTESDSHRTLLALYWFLWTDIRTLHGGVVVRRRTIRRFWGLGRAPVYRGWENRNFVRPISVAFFPSMLPRTWSFSQSSRLPDRVRALRSGGWLGIGRQLYVPVSMQPSPHRHCLLESRIVYCRIQWLCNLPREHFIYFSLYSKLFLTC